MAGTLSTMRDMRQSGILVLDEAIYVYDSYQSLAGETLAVMVTGTSDEQDGT